MTLYLTILCTFANMTIPYNSAVAISEDKISYYSLVENTMVVKDITDSDTHLKYTVIYTENAAIAIIKERKIVIVENGVTYELKIKKRQYGIRNKI